MILKGKYIIIEDRGIEVPILFSALLKHEQVAVGETVVAAGFFDIMPNGDGFEVYATRGSLSLGVNSRPQDVEIILKNFKYDPFSGS